MKVSGNKNELIERLIKNVPKDKLENIFDQKKYLLTTRGKEILNSNDHIKFFHSQSKIGISIFHAHAIKKERPELSKYDIAWEQLVDSSIQFAKNGDWGLYRNNKYSMSIILEFKNNLSDSLGSLFDVCYHDLSGMSNGFDLKYIEIYEKYFFPYTNSNHTLAPGIISKMQDLKGKLTFNDKEFEEFGLKYLEKVETPIHLFTKQVVLNIITGEMYSNKEVVKDIYEDARKRYEKQGINVLLTGQVN